MLFNSFAFLGCFALLAVTYYAVPHAVRLILLLAASLLFYATFDLAYVLLLGAVTAIAYVGGIAIAGARDGSKPALAVSTVLVLGALLLFKYYEFVSGSLTGVLAAVGLTTGPVFPRLELVLAVGLSFYTFSCVSYLVDVHRGRLAVERRFARFALYASFFPKLLAGPIERPAPFLGQLDRPVSFNPSGVATGLQWMLWGLFKKVVIADRLAVFVDVAYAAPALASPADLVLATYFFAFQLYCDFSGYSDIAIGAAKVLGIDLMENFRRPYLSVSTREFWARRWHVSLAAWFRDYMYIPLGGSRVSRVRRYGNVMAVFMTSGLWHGANWTFVVWGAVNGAYHVIGDLTEGIRTRLHRVLDLPRWIATPARIVVTFHLILVTWVFFRAASIVEAWTVVTRVAGSAAALPSLVAARVGAGGILYPLGLIALLLGVETLDERRPVWERLRERPVYVRWAAYYALIIGLIVLGSWQLRTFVYMQF